MRKLYIFFFLIINGFMHMQAAVIPGGNEGANPSLSVLYNIASESDIAIYPNPVKNFATIEFSKGVDRVVIMNIVGKEVKTFTPETDAIEIRVNLTDLQPGVYFIAAYSNGVKLITKRFMKEQ